MRELVQWQLIDPSNDQVFPWFTHPFLEVLKTWDLHDKTVLEYGAGLSTGWWAAKCEKVVSVETEAKWRDIAYEVAKKYAPTVFLVPTNEGEQDPEKVSRYVNIAQLHEGYYFDIVVVDGILRYECMKRGIELLSKKGGKMIVDNWQQDGFICPACVELMAAFEQYVFPQPGHTDHHGNCWKTAFFIIP